jgi:hypothetical protein
MDDSRIKVGELQVGMPLPFDVFDADDRLLLSRGHLIASEAQLERLMKQGVFRRPPSASTGADGTRVASGQSAKPVRVSREVSVFRMAGECARRLEALIDGPKPGPGARTFADEIKALAHLVQQICRSDGDAALAYVLLGQAPRYTVRQQINVAILITLMLSRMERGSVRIEPSVAAALTMNIGMLALEELYWTSGQLDEDQRAALREHPSASVQALLELGVDDTGWLQIVVQHHEALDGSGYPRGIKGADICLEARAIMVADRYNGKVMGRAYRHGLAPDCALKELARRDEHAIDPSLLGLLIKVIGVYPPGTVVVLADKEVGVVTNRLLDLKHPIVRAFFIESDWPYDQPVKRFTGKMPQFEIAKVLSRDALSCPIDAEQLWPPCPFVEDYEPPNQL